MRRLAVPAPSWVLSTGELVRDRLATLKSDWVALGRPVPAGMLAAACTAAETLTSATGDRAVDAALHHEQVLGGSGNPGSPSIPAYCAATSGSTSPAACGTGSTRCPTPRRSTSTWRSSPTLRASTGNTLAAQRSSAPSTTGCGVSSMDSPRIPSAAASRHRAASVTRPSLPRRITRGNDGSPPRTSSSAPARKPTAHPAHSRGPSARPTCGADRLDRMTRRVSRSKRYLHVICARAPGTARWRPRRRPHGDHRTSLNSLFDAPNRRFSRLCR